MEDILVNKNAITIEINRPVDNEITVKVRRQRRLNNGNILAEQKFAPGFGSSFSIECVVYPGTY